MDGQEPRVKGIERERREKTIMETDKGNRGKDIVSREKAKRRRRTTKQEYKPI